MANFHGITYLFLIFVTSFYLLHAHPISISQRRRCNDDAIDVHGECVKINTVIDIMDKSRDIICYLLLRCRSESDAARYCSSNPAKKMEEKRFFSNQGLLGRR